MNRGAESEAVRAMTAADLDRVLEIADGLDTAPRWPGAAYEALVEPAQSDIEVQRIALVAEDAGTGSVVGFLVASLIPPVAELETVGVAAEFQRHGVGRRLLAELEGKLRRGGVTKVLLEVRNSNVAAKSLYGSSGFVETGSRRGYYADPVEDAAVMQLIL
jgi:[ribosomal protein S18]-alanine N-acetyltransferase